MCKCLQLGIFHLILIFVHFSNCEVITEEKGIKEDEEKFANVSKLTYQKLLPVSGQIKLFDGNASHNLINSIEVPWTWTCVENVCKRSLYVLGQKTCLDVCWLTCGKPHYSLWPQPKQVQMGKHLISFSPKNLFFEKFVMPRNSPTSFRMLNEATHIFRENLQNMFNPKISTTNEIFDFESSWISIQLEVGKDISVFTLGTDESYALSIHESKNSDLTDDPRLVSPQGKTLHINIFGKNFFGVRHGLETLLQLIAFDEFENCFKITKSAKIKDKPAFTYRGLMIDSGRNFQPISYIKKVINGMAQNKLNIFHFHISDSDSFPIYIKSVPQMTKYGAFDKDKIYHPYELQDLVRYARVRGVKIIPEIDFPAHAGNGWQWGEKEGLGALALCVNKMPWVAFSGQPPAGILNPINKNTYLILEKIYQEVFEIFDQDIFHMGGDEIGQSLNCWNQNKDIQAWKMLINSTSSDDPQNFFQQEAFKILKNKSSNKSKSSNKKFKAILWAPPRFYNRESRMSLLSPKDYILQLWQNTNVMLSLDTYVEEKFKMIISLEGVHYLDHGGGTWRMDQFDESFARHSWRDIYNYDYLFKNYSHVDSILGGSALLWSERVNQNNLEIKLWPRATALAERLWSNPAEQSGDLTMARILQENHRKHIRGISTDTIAPEACRVIFGYC